MNRNKFEIVFAMPQGFCAGVEYALNLVNEVKNLDKFTKYYFKHPIVHNKTVVSGLSNAGIKTIEDVDEIPVGGSVFFSAHGSPPSDYKKAKNRNLKIYDAICPLVTKVHNQVKKFNREGYKVILIGHKEHQEVIGTMGHGDVFIYDERQKNQSLPPWSKDEKVAVITQTTLSVFDTKLAIEKIKQHFTNALVKNDICYATTNRQKAIMELVKQVEAVLVIGSQTSSNCMKLNDIAAKEVEYVQMIENYSQLDMNKLKQFKRIGITSGASTPKYAVLEVVVHLNPSSIEYLRVAEENFTFKSPKIYTHSL